MKVGYHPVTTSGVSYDCPVCAAAVVWRAWHTNLSPLACTASFRSCTVPPTECICSSCHCSCRHHNAAAPHQSNILSCQHKVRIPRQQQSLTHASHWLQTVFFDLRRPVLEELYEHHVESARLHPVLVLLDAALEDMVTAASESLPPYLARSLLQAITMAMQRILLDGGPYRCAALCFGEYLLLQLCCALVDSCFLSCAVLCCAVLSWAGLCCAVKCMVSWHILRCWLALLPSGHHSNVCCALS